MKHGASMDMVIDHIGIVVKSLDEGLEQWTSLFGYTPLTEAVANTRQRVRVIFLSKPDSCLIKLVEPTDDQSPVYKFALRGGGLHHICFRCADVTSAIERFREKGYHVLSDPLPGEAFGNEKIAFFYARQGLNVELIDTDKKAGRKDDQDG
jgi:methylmalonyl-CoA/ethylmalonyl-CoA epimerase